MNYEILREFSLKAINWLRVSEAIQVLKNKHNMLYTSRTLLSVGGLPGLPLNCVFFVSQRVANLYWSNKSTPMPRQRVLHFFGSATWSLSVSKTMNQ